MTLGFAGSCFCGGFKSIFAIDNDRAAAASYGANFGDHVTCGDIEEWLSGNHEIPQADVVIGGPPCQGFSLLNKARKGDARRALWQPYMDIVKMADASVFVIENVQGLLNSPEHLSILQRAKEDGFYTQSLLLNAADFGTPQTRIRAFIIGWKQCLGESVSFSPIRTHAAESNHLFLSPWRTVRDVIADLPPPEGTEIRELPPPLNLHFGRTPTEKSVQRYKAIPLGGNRFDLHRNAPELMPECWIRKKSGGTDLFGRLWWDRPSVTIRTEFFKPEKGRYLHPDQHRPITHREAARLMGFPDEFILSGSKIEIARQIGNAVPPPLAAAIARQIKQVLDFNQGV